MDRGKVKPTVGRCISSLRRKLHAWALRGSHPVALEPRQRRLSVDIVRDDEETLLPLLFRAINGPARLAGGRFTRPASLMGTQLPHG